MNYFRNAFRKLLPFSSGRFDSWNVKAPLVGGLAAGAVALESDDDEPPISLFNCKYVENY